MAEPLRTFLPRLRRRPGIYVPRMSYATVCAFIDGYALASDESLNDFRLWLIRRGTTRPELWWTSLVLTQIYPPDELPNPRTFTDQEDEHAIAVLFDLLEEFYGQE